MRKSTPAGPTMPGTAAQIPLLLSAPETADFLGIAESTLHKLVASGQVPRARALGRRRLWSRDELRAWVDAGCPARSTWEAMGGARA